MTSIQVRTRCPGASCAGQIRFGRDKLPGRGRGMEAPERRERAFPPYMHAGHGGLLLPGGAHERVFCAPHSCRPLIVIGGSKELRGMDRRGGGPFGGGV